MYTGGISLLYKAPQKVPPGLFSLYCIYLYIYLYTGISLLYKAPQKVPPGLFSFYLCICIQVSPCCIRLLRRCHPASSPYTVTIYIYCISVYRYLPAVQGPPEGAPQPLLLPLTLQLHSLGLCGYDRYFKNVWTFLDKYLMCTFRDLKMKKNRSYCWKYLKKVNICGFEIPNATAAILYLDLWKSIAIVHIFFVQTCRGKIKN